MEKYVRERRCGTSGKIIGIRYKFFDTAPIYGHGTGEARLGKALKGVDRSKIVINTKFGRTDSGDTDFSSDYIRISLEGSLKDYKLIMLIRF